MAVSVALPAPARALIEQSMQGVSRIELAARADRISQAYRRGAPSQSVIASAADALSYAVTRMPATYAAMRTVLAKAVEHGPDINPQSVLDIGAGPGTAVLAATDTWPGLREAILLEPNVHLADMAKTLATNAGLAVRHVAADVALTDKLTEPVDIVLCSYVQVELSDVAAEHLVAATLAAARMMVVLVEPGTKAGFARIRRAREIVAARGWHIAAPCPHANECPLQVDDWCHFSVRLARSRDHRLVKGADAPFEDEPYSYVVATRETPTPATARILRAPVVSKGEVRLSLCAGDGLEERSVARRDADYKSARKADAGDAW